MSLDSGARFVACLSRSLEGVAGLGLDGASPMQGFAERVSPVCALGSTWLCLVVSSRGQCLGGHLGANPTGTWPPRFVFLLL